MARRGGRKRKIGEREPNGRLQRHDAGPDRGTIEGQMQTARILGEARQGIEKDDALALLASLGHLTNEQAAAGTDYGNAHRALYGQPWPKAGESIRGRSLAEGDRSGLERKVERGINAISTAGGNAVTIARLVCIARHLPSWAQFGPVITVKKINGKVGFAGAADRDRQKLRAMRKELPALKKALDALVKAHFGGKRMEMAA